MVVVVFIFIFFIIGCVPLGCMMCLSSNMFLHNSSLCRYLRDSLGVRVGIFLLVASIVFQGARGGGSLIIYFGSGLLHSFFRRNRVQVMGDLIRSWCVICEIY